jgi:hypothetical protein
MDIRMNTLHAKFQLALVEAAQSQMRAQHYQTRINAETYKARVGHVFHGGFNGTPLSEAEVLQSEVATMARHITLAESHLDYAKELLSMFKEN